MADNSQEQRIASLAAEIEQLKLRLLRLEKNLRPSMPPERQSPDLEILSQVEASEPQEGKKSTEGLWAWLGQGSLLPGLAAVSFILVLGLLLRTLTDMEVMPPWAGSYLGLGYAAVLLGLGEWLLRRRSRLAAIFPVCGAMLMCLIVLEAHGRFETLSAPAAYLLLLATLLMLIRMAGRHGLPFLGTLGLVGAGISGFAVDFPDPGFPLLAMFLLVASLAAYLLANRFPQSEAGRWVLFLLTVVFWLNWMVKLNAAPVSGDLASPGPGFFWFLPLLLLFLLIFNGLTAHRAFGLGRLSLLDSLLPTLSGLLFYLAARSALAPWEGQAVWMGTAGLVWSGLLGLAAVLALHRSGAGGKAACVFTFAGAALFLLALPDLTGRILLALPVWSLGALFLIRLSSRCEIGGIRLASYLLQVTAGVAGILSGSFGVNSADLMLSIGVAGWLTAMSGFHYLISRRNPLACSAGFLARFDPGDKIAIVLLLMAVVNGFFLLQLGAATVLAGAGSGSGMVLQGLRSVFLNCGAILLMVLGLRSRNQELLGVALAVFIAGAGKVFGYDFFEIRGVPLLMSVFSFGAAAALASLVLSRQGESRLLKNG